MELNERKKNILKIIVEDYISTAEPIGSRTIARKYEIGLSPATIRNEMSDLEMMGYLEQPHTSAGRIPSAKGYRLYVDSLGEPIGITAQEIIAIEEWYENRTRKLEEVFKITASVLSSMTNNLSLVSTRERSNCQFKYVRFLPLDGHRSIIILVTDDGIMENNVFVMPEGVTFDDLEIIGERINNRLSGLSIADVKAEMLADVYSEVYNGGQVYNSIFNIVQQVREQSQKNNFYLGGRSQILSQPEFQDVHRVKEILRMLEEERVLQEILLGSDEHELQITIGAENKFSGIQDCSMIKATYSFHGQIVGTLAVLGPTRMEYSKAISVMSYLRKYLQELFKGYK